MPRHTTRKPAQPSTPRPPDPPPRERLRALLATLPLTRDQRLDVVAACEAVVLDDTARVARVAEREIQARAHEAVSAVFDIRATIERETADAMSAALLDVVAACRSAP